NLGQLRVVQLEKNSVSLEIVHLNLLPAPRKNIELVVALPRPQILKKVLQSAAMLGVSKLNFVCAARTEPGYRQSKMLNPESIHHNLLLGLEQAMNTLMPEVKIFHSLHNLLEKLDHSGRLLCLAQPGAD